MWVTINWWIIQLELLDFSVTITVNFKRTNLYVLETVDTQFTSSTSCWLFQRRASPGSLWVRYVYQLLNHHRQRIPALHMPVMQVQRWCLQPVVIVTERQELSIAGVNLFPCLVQLLHCFWMLLEMIGQVCQILALQLIATWFLSPSFCLYFDYTCSYRSTFHTQNISTRDSIF